MFPRLPMLSPSTYRTDGFVLSSTSLSLFPEKERGILTVLEYTAFPSKGYSLVKAEVFNVSGFLSPSRFSSAVPGRCTSRHSAYCPEAWDSTGTAFHVPSRKRLSLTPAPHTAQHARTAATVIDNRFPIIPPQDGAHGSTSHSAYGNPPYGYTGSQALSTSGISPKTTFPRKEEAHCLS